MKLLNDVLNTKMRLIIYDTVKKLYCDWKYISCVIVYSFSMKLASPELIFSYIIYGQQF